MYILCSSFCCCCRFAENKNLNESASALVGSVIYVTWCFFSTRTGLGYTIIWVISLIWNMSTVKQSYETCRIPLDWRYLQSDIFKQHSGGVWVSDSCCSRYSIVELSQYHTQMNAMRNYKLCLSEKYVVLFIARPIQFDMLNNSTYQLAVRWCLNKLFLSVHSEKCTPHTHTHIADLLETLMIFHSICWMRLQMQVSTNVMHVDRIESTFRPSNMMHLYFGLVWYKSTFCMQT